MFVWSYFTGGPGGVMALGASVCFSPLVFTLNACKNYFSKLLDAFVFIRGGIVSSFGMDMKVEKDKAK